MAPLRALVAEGHDVALVVSRADRRRGRGSELSPSPVKAAALELGLPVTDRVDDVVEAGAELGVVVAYGRLVRPHLLERLPFVNLHFSLLPRWRGAAPVERAILAGDAETGVCLMRLEEGLDTGPVYGCRRLPIGSEETADELRARLVEAGTAVLVERLRSGLGEPAPQRGEPTYAAKVEPEERRLDWSRPAVEVHRTVRIGDAWTTFRGKRLKVLRAHLAADSGAVPPAGPQPRLLADGGAPTPPDAVAVAPGTVCGDVVACGDGALRLVEVQPEGKAALGAADWRNGARLRPGERLGG